MVRRFGRVEQGLELRGKRFEELYGKSAGEMVFPRFRPHDVSRNRAVEALAEEEDERRGAVDDADPDSPYLTVFTPSEESP